MIRKIFASFDACRSQVPDGPFIFDSDGKVQVSSYNSHYEITDWNDKTGVLIFRPKQNLKEAFKDPYWGQHDLEDQYEVDFFKNPSKSVVAMRMTEEEKVNGEMIPSQTLSYVFLVGDQDKSCVLQRSRATMYDMGQQFTGHNAEGGRANSYVEKIAKESFDLGSCKALLEFLDKHPSVPQCESLHYVGGVFVGYSNTEKELAREVKETRNKLSNEPTEEGGCILNGSQSVAEIRKMDCNVHPANVSAEKKQDQATLGTLNKYLQELHTTGKEVFADKMSGNYSDCPKYDAQYIQLASAAGGQYDGKNWPNTVVDYSECSKEKNYVLQYFASHPNLAPGDVKYNDSSPPSASQAK